MSEFKIEGLSSRASSLLLEHGMHSLEAVHCYLAIQRLKYPDWEHPAGSNHSVYLARLKGCGPKIADEIKAWLGPAPATPSAAFFDYAHNTLRMHAELEDIQQSHQALCELVAKKQAQLEQLERAYKAHAEILGQFQLLINCNS